MDDLGAAWTAAMRSGRYADAWAISDGVLAARDAAGRDDPALPYHQRWVWDGRGYDGLDVLVRCYHGLGDTIQYARFLPSLSARAASLTLEVQPELAGLLAQLPGIDRIVPFDPANPLPQSACDIEITELPHALRAGPADGAAIPYLAVPPAPLPPGSVGLRWGAGGWDLERCVAPELFAPLTRMRPCVSLNPEPAALPLVNPEGCSFDITETAALAAGCAVVVAVDTMVAHLAGAMGVPTLLLLKAEPDWRWTPGRADTPWYPGMRVLKQDTPGDWTGVIAQAERLLAEVPA